MCLDDERINLVSPPEVFTEDSGFSTSGTLWRILREVTPSKKDQETPPPSDRRSSGWVDPYGNARLLQQQQRLGSGASDNTGHTSILHVATVSFAPARKFALVDGVFIPRARHIVHPDQTSTWTQKPREREGVRNWTFYSEVRTFLPNRLHISTPSAWV